jgi:hypothetical protein
MAEQHEVELRRDKMSDALRRARHKHASLVLTCSDGGASGSSDEVLMPRAIGSG